jgi:hypothetical protein
MCRMTGMRGVIELQDALFSDESSVVGRFFARLPGSYRHQCGAQAQIYRAGGVQWDGGRYKRAFRGPVHQAQGHAAGGASLRSALLGAILSTK